MIGFITDAEREFFDAICSVDGVGVKKALQAMVRPVRDVAVAIEEQNLKNSPLPGIGMAMAEPDPSPNSAAKWPVRPDCCRDFPASRSRAGSPHGDLRSAPQPGAYRLLPMPARRSTW
ncbi:MAG: hypothetical protein U0903_08845 [Planctomycetales bacterium]